MHPEPVATPARSVIVGTAGHIDHGKSALVRALTGTDPDRLKEEKARGITIDLGFAHRSIDGIDFDFVDVPGHERFVKNMLAGVGGIELVMLVVAADESVMPQTREHFEICRLLEVPAGVVVLTKSDLADQDMLDLARLEVRELVAGSFLEQAPMVAVSARTEAGLDDLRAALVAATLRLHERSRRTQARLPIDRVFSRKGFGTVVTGTLASGTIAADQELVQELALLPGSRLVKVRGVQVHGERRPLATAGHRTAVNIGGVEVEDVSRGQTLTTPGAFVASRVADAVVEVLSDAKPLKHGTRVRFHQGTAEVMGRVALVEREGRAVEPGARAYARLRLEAPAVLARGDRYILRAYSPPVTIAGGVVLDPVPPRSRVRSAATLARLEALDPKRAANLAASDVERRALAALVDDGGQAGLSVEALVWRAGVDRASLDAAVQRLVDHGDAIVACDVLVSPRVVAALRDAIVATLTANHQAQPLSEGVPREELRTQLFARGAAAVFEQALQSLGADGRIVIRDRIALASHRVALSPQEEAARQAIDRAFRDGGLTPPDASAVMAALSVDRTVAERVVKLLQRQKVLIRLDTLLFHEAALQGLKTEIGKLKSGSAGAPARIDVATFKERFGVSRKFAIPLLEYLDRERLTRRVGDARVIL